MKLEVLVGVSAAGKSTAAAKRVLGSGNMWIKLDRDDLRFSLTCSQDWNDYVFDKHIEKMITQMHRAAIVKAASRGINVIVAETNLSPKARNGWKEVAREFGFEYVETPLHISYEEAIDRDSRRIRSVGKKVIDGQWCMWQDYLAQTGEEAQP